MHYQAGDRAAFHPEVIKFLKNNRFVMKKNVNKNIRSGTALIVAFSNNQNYAIGMFESPTEGFLFDEHFYEQIWQSVAIEVSNDPLQVTTRMLTWASVDLDQIYPPYFKPECISMPHDM
jgi:hypothetical protein